MTLNLTGSSVINGIITLAALLAALAAIWRYLIRTPIRFARRVEDALKQLSPNGGSSLRDAVDRIEGRTSRIEERLEAIDARVGVLERIHERQVLVDQILAENAAKLAQSKGGPDDPA